MLNLFLIIIMEALFALTFPLGKLALCYTGVLFLIGMRMTLAGIVLLTYQSLVRGFSKMEEKADIWLFAKTTLFYVYLAFVPEFWALETMSAIKSNMLWSSLPFVSALFGYYFYNERLTPKKWAGLTVGLLGMLPVIFMINPAEAARGAFLNITLPDILMVITVVSTAYGLFLVKQLMAKGYSLININGITMFFGGLLCFITRLVYVSSPYLYTDFWPLMGYVAALIVISNILGYALYGYLLRSYSITFLSFAGFLCPLFGAFFSKLLLNESLHYQHAIAFAAVLAGMLIFYREELVADFQKTILK